MGRDTLICAAVRHVVIEAYRKPYSIASNFAREHKEPLAQAASLGLITVFYPDTMGTRDVWTDHTWRPTIKGLQYTILDT